MTEADNCDSKEQPSSSPPRGISRQEYTRRVLNRMLLLGIILMAALTVAVAAEGLDYVDRIVVDVVGGLFILIVVVFTVYQVETIQRAY